MTTARGTGRGKVLVAMSGGVDSSVAAALLLRAGYEVVGVFMRLGSPGETLDCLTPLPPAETTGPASSRPLRIGHQGCCSINDAADARLVAAELGIPFYVVNFKKDFGRIIDYFADEYARGRTPNPCVRCNDWLKFGKLHDYARQIDADFVASGHYARINPSPLGGEDSLTRQREAGEGKSIPARLNPSPASGRGQPCPSSGMAGEGVSPQPPLLAGSNRGPRAEGQGPLFRLLRAIDHAKDQSYVLFGIPRGQLARTLLPIGEMHKSEVRGLARRLGLPVFDKPDSQEICFVPDNDYAALVERRRPDAAKPGDILDPGGNIVGAHDGQHRFTIGQRRGVGVALGYPIYVVGKDPDANTITVGPRELLLTTSCTATEANWLLNPSPLGGEDSLTLQREAGEGTSTPADPRLLHASGHDARLNPSPACGRGQPCPSSGMAGEGKSIPILARYRYNAPPVPATLTLLSDEPPDAPPTPSGRRGRFRIDFDTPQQAVAPGQAIVLYDADEPDVVVGGGWISSTG